MLEEKDGWKPLVDYKSQVANFDPIRLQRVKELYEEGRAWSLGHFEEIYAVLGTKFDFSYFECMMGEFGSYVVNKALLAGVFKKDDGAVIFEGEKYGLHTRVFINSYGFPTYEAKELGLAKKKFDDFGYDKSIVVTGNEIEEYFKVVLKAIDLVYPDLEGRIIHIPHGMMKLSSGKMSSRTGQVISGMDLVEEVTASVRERVQSSGIVPDDEVEGISTKIAVGAIKYGILKNGIGKDITYDKEASLEMTGNTGAYLQYSFVRASSVLEKASDSIAFDESFLEHIADLSEDETELLRSLYVFPDIVDRATHEFAPNYVCTYLFELAQTFNRFYSSHPILEVEDNIQRKFRLCLTKGVSLVLRNGLYLLGIETVPKM
jgi:arginyl-tRNA synthetase